MTVAILLGILGVGVAVVLATIFLRRSPMSDDGIADFKRHLDALSPEARRPIVEAMKKDDDQGSGNGA
ncbi:MAG: hypothetical protein ACKOBT_08270 [Actinomycetota bacterium]